MPKIGDKIKKENTLASMEELARLRSSHTITIKDADGNVKNPVQAGKAEKRRKELLAQVEAKLA